MNCPISLLSGSPPRDGAAREIPVILKEMLRGGLSLLWRSYQYSSDLNADSREFAVDCDALYRAGLSAIDLRWLIARDYVEVAPNAAFLGNRKQSPENTQPFEGKNTCFILTKAGVALALQLLSPILQSNSQMPSQNGKGELATDFSGYAIPDPRPGMPTWDRERKELRLGNCVVKQFRWAALNQETILMAFEEEGWPARIDDPLPQKLNQDPKIRLHDTIKCLNRNHKKRLLRFSGDGTGEGILWTHRDDAELDS